MPYLNFYSAKPALKLLIIFFSVITIGIITFFVGLLLGRLIFWMHLDQVNDVLYGRYELLSNWQLKYFQLIQSLGFFVLPGLFLHWLFSTPTEKYFNIEYKARAIHVIILVVVFIVGTPLINWLVDMNQKVVFPDYMKSLETSLRQTEDSYAQFTGRLLSVNNFGYYLFNLLIIAIIPAIGEELIFRGIFQKFFIEISKNINLSVIITAILFSAIHGQFFGFIPRFLLGVFLGYLMIWGKSVWFPIIAHFINNAVAVTSYYLYSTGALNTSPDSIGTTNKGGYLVLISIGLTAFLIYFLRNQLKKTATALKI